MRYTKGYAFIATDVATLFVGFYAKNRHMSK